MPYQERGRRAPLRFKAFRLLRFFRLVPGHGYGDETFLIRGRTQAKLLMDAGETVQAGKGKNVSPEKRR